MWGPVLAWCALQLLAESIDPDHPETVALDIFDRLRLRDPFAKAFTALGIDGETGWRVAARIKVVLLTGAGIGREVPPISAPESAPTSSQSAAPLIAAISDGDVALYQGTTSVVPQTPKEEAGALAPEGTASSIPTIASTSGQALYQGTISALPLTEGAGGFNPRIEPN
jgi:hypothetical protein